MDERPSLGAFLRSRRERRTPADDKRAVRAAVDESRGQHEDIATKGLVDMAFTRWAFIYLGLGTEDPARHRAVIEHGGLRTTVVAVPDRAAAVPVAAELVDDGAQSVELCGAFGPADVARVLEATGGRVPVGAAMYGMESVPKLAALFAGEE